MQKPMVGCNRLDKMYKKEKNFQCLNQDACRKNKKY